MKTKERSEYMKKIITILLPALIILVLGLLTVSCGTIKEVPVQTVEKVVYRDSLIYVNDTLTIPVPYEKIVEVLPEVDTSHLETSVAKSTAYLDTAKRKLHHTLEQKGSIKYVHDTVHVVEYIDRIIEKDVPVEVEVIKYKRDSLFWVLVGWAEHRFGTLFSKDIYSLS
jgi:hypothetical protein